MYSTYGTQKHQTDGFCFVPCCSVCAQILQPLDPLLEGEESLLYTADVNMGNARSPTMPVQGGFLVIRPDLAVYGELVEVCTRGCACMKNL